MAEFIVEYPDDLIAEGYVTNCINIHERITRCRSCKHCEVTDWTNYILYEYRESEIKHLCHEFADYEGTPTVVEPDGFCAWGEPKVVE